MINFNLNKLENISNEFENYMDKIIQINRVTKVTTGGKKMSFRVSIIIGDTKQKVGFGVGSAEDVDLAWKKALANAKKQLIIIPINKFESIPYLIKVYSGACKLLLCPAKIGTGIIAGGSVRTVLELVGIKNIVAKQFGSTNSLNIAKTTLMALALLNQKIELKKTLYL